MTAGGNGMRRAAVLVGSGWLMVAPAFGQGQLAGPGAAVTSVTLPPEIDRVLRDYERGWRSHDASGLAALFAEDGFVLSNGSPPVRGRAAIREAHAKAGGPLNLRAIGYSTVPAAR